MSLLAPGLSCRNRRSFTITWENPTTRTLSPRKVGRDLPEDDSHVEPRNRSRRRESALILCLKANKCADSRRRLRGCLGRGRRPPVFVTLRPSSRITSSAKRSANCSMKRWEARAPRIGRRGPRRRRRAWSQRGLREGAQTDARGGSAPLAKLRILEPACGSGSLLIARPPRLRLLPCAIRAFPTGAS